MSRRGALALVGSGALFVAVLTAGQTVGGFTRRAALLLPRGRSRGEGPNDFQVNKTAAAAAITPADIGADWRLTVRGPSGQMLLDRAALEAMPQHTAELPIACVEGWSTTQTWSGVRLRDLAALAGMPNPARATVRSLERPAGSITPSCKPIRSAIPTRCWPFGSTASTCLLITAIPRASSCPRCRACTTPNGCGPSNSDRTDMRALVSAVHRLLRQ